MTLLARDIMVEDYDTIHKDGSLDDAIGIILNGKVRETGHKTVSVMVLDDFNKLAGVITMYDILYHLRPSFLNRGISGDELDWGGQLKYCMKHLKEKSVSQVMSPHLTGASPDEHLMVILDRMVKNKYRRLPVLENGKPVGIVYLSDIYYHLFNRSHG